ncbi:MAG: ShlB/FhaC/HecB family hemolysin secretion/activation protein [Bacillota bacterium]
MLYNNLVLNKMKVDYCLKLLLIIGVIVLSLMFIFTSDASAQNNSIYVEKIETNSSTVLSETELNNLIFDYQNRNVTINELRELVSKINELYTKKGYITAQAVLPEQNVENGVVKIELIEGKIGEIILQGNQYTKNRYIINRLSINRGDIIRIDTLEEELFYFNVVNDINIQADLKAGKEYGTTDLILKINEPSKTQKSIFTDNRGRKESGKIRYGFNYSNNSLLGYRDRINFSYFETEGTKGGTISYDFPIKIWDARTNISYNNNVSDILYGDYESVSIKGEYEDYGVSFNLPLIVKEGFKADGGFEYKYKRSDTFFSGSNLLETDIETYSLHLTTQSVKKNKLLFGNYNILKGYTKSGQGDYDNPGVSSEFMKYNVFFERQHVLNNKDSLNIKTYVQLANNKLLPSSEQFSIGGMSTVRGYEEGRLTGDQGYYITLELSKRLDESKEYFVFIDHGGVLPYKGNEEDYDQDDYLTSLGQGLNFNFRNNISGKFILAVPTEGQEGPRVHFSIQKSW